MKRLAVLISGNGSNLQVLIDAIGAKTLPARIALVLSNRVDAFGLERARRAGVPTATLPLNPSSAKGGARATYDAELARQVAEVAPDLIVLAGWMHILGAEFLDRFPGKVINLHPALPGCFPGTNAIARALSAYQRHQIAETGVMVHQVVPEIDAGPVLGTMPVPIDPNDTLDSLSRRVHAAEHALILNVIQRLVSV